MKLVASMIVRNEAGRYLAACVEHLLEFCDEIRVLDDHSTDRSGEWLAAIGGVRTQANVGTSFFEHEGRARNVLLDWTLEADPTHILAIDADEFVTDGEAVRDTCYGLGDVFTLQMEEVWRADPDGLQIRVDGGWRRRQVPILYRVPEVRGRDFQIANRALACGREPMSVAKQAIRGKAAASGSSILHFGWTREAERKARYDRYVQHDLGKSGGHADQHLLSIMWSDSQVTLEPREWPAGLDREAILG